MLYLCRGLTNLGIMYMEGLGVKKDDKEAFELFLEAAQQQHSRAQLRLADMLLEGRGCQRSPSQALEWYLAAAEGGSTVALCAVAGMFESGVGCEQNLAKAVEFYEMAALRGDFAASERLITLVANHTLLDNVLNCGHAARAA
jgi:uncharacterized protein